MNKVLKGCMGVFGGMTSYLFGGWSALLGVLLVLVIIDFLTGLTAGAIEKKLASEIGFKGIARKVGIFVIIVCGHLIDIVLGTGTMIRDAASFFYIANELLSIVENAGRIGLPVPEVFTQAIKILNDKSEPKLSEKADEE